jgi:hypothetical protein
MFDSWSFENREEIKIVICVRHIEVHRAGFPVFRQHDPPPPPQIPPIGSLISLIIISGIRQSAPLSPFPYLYPVDTVPATEMNS